MLINALILMFSGYLVQRFMGALTFEFLERNGVVKRNYQGEKIITAAGLAIYISMSLILIPLLFIFGYTHEILIFFLGCTLIVFVGFWDDLWGDDLIKGVSGHVQALFKGQLTTGSIKALVGLLVAMLISYYYSNNLLLFIVNTLLLALLINTLNLMDLRPGRAGKFFFLLALPLLLAYGIKGEGIILFLLLGILVAYLPLDLKGLVMLGDTGSNLLGFIIGFYGVAAASLGVKIFLLTLLCFLHWYGEKYSLTKFIARVKILNYLDNIGRPEV